MAQGEDRDVAEIHSIEYRCLSFHLSSVQYAVSSNLLSLGARLLSLGIISHDTYESLLISSRTMTERAGSLMFYIQQRVRLQPDCYHLFIDVLMEDWDLYDSILHLLYDTYQSLATKERAKLDVSPSNKEGISILTTGMYFLKRQ